MIKTTLILILLQLTSISTFSQQSNNTIFPLVEDAYLYSPLGQYSFWFQTNPGTTITDSCFVRIDYSKSNMIIPEKSVMTLLINDKPVSSTNINSSDSGSSSWNISIPATMISPGFNRVTLSTIQRTSDDPCVDFYNKSNWVTIKKSTFFTASFVKDSAQYISDFPYPFINLLDHKSAVCNVVLPRSPANQDFDALLALAELLGGIKTGNGLRFNVSPEDTARYKIFLGTMDNYTSIFPNPLPAGTGIIKLVSDSNQTFLYISGSDHEGIKNSISALKDTDLRYQMDTSEAVISNYYTPRDIFSTANVRLTDLGVNDLKIQGIFDQSAFLTVKRPVNLLIGADSYLRLNFKHSANLNPDQSILTALVNGKPSASIKLDGSNADGGFIDVKIPMDQLDRNEWMIELACYQDIGNIGSVDCSHLYNESVWTYIDAENSEVVFSDGNNKANPDLQNFPYSLAAGSVDSSVILFCFPENPAKELIELSASIASKIGKSSANQNIKVSFGKPSEESLKLAGSVIMMGYADDDAVWNDIKDSLYIKPDAGSFNVSDDIGILNNDLTNTGILQGISSPWNDGVIYAVMLPRLQGPSSLEYLVNDDSYSNISGQVALLKSNGEIVSLSSTNVFVPVTEYASFLSGVPSLYWYLLGAVVALCIIFLTMRLFRKRI